jgi:hypothetical protein
MARANSRDDHERDRTPLGVSCENAHDHRGGAVTRSGRPGHIVLAVAIVIMIAADLFVVHARHVTAKPVTINQALERFRSHLHTASPAPSTVETGALPRPGVYTYATTGTEKIDLPGGSRMFPGTTTITVESSGCGVTEEWAPTSEHSESRQLCADAGTVRLASFTSRVAFFGFGNTETYRCGTDAVVYLTHHATGPKSSFRCTSGDSTAAETVTPKGIVRLRIGRRTVRTVRLSVRAALSGANAGTSDQNLWFTTGRGVLVRTAVHTDARQRGVDYHADYTLRLNDLHPQR